MVNFTQQEEIGKHKLHRNTTGTTPLKHSAILDYSDIARVYISNRRGTFEISVPLRIKLELKFMEIWLKIRPL